MDPGASLAKRCIEHVLDVLVMLWDVPPRQSAHDLMFELEGRRVAVEVKQLVDPDYRAAEKEAFTLGYTPADELEYSWDVRLGDHAKWKEVFSSIVPVLRRLEHLGWPGGNELWRIRRVDEDVHRQVTQMGVRSLWPHPPSQLHPSGFYLMPEARSGGIPPLWNLLGDLAQFLKSEEMHRLRRQLRDAEADERHAFLILGWERLDAYALAGELELPTSPLELPDPIDGMWVTATMSDANVVGWLPTEGWVGRGPPPQSRRTTDR